MYYVDPSGHICAPAAQRITEKLGNHQATRKEQKKLAAYLRHKERNGGLTDAERRTLAQVDRKRCKGGGDSVYIPRDADGNPIPLKKQTVNGQDIPLPDPAAEGRPHTVLGGKVSSKTGEEYRQSATFPGGTWPTVNGHDVPWSEVHWTDHGTPQHHTNPHQHIFEYNPDKGGWIRKSPTEFEP